MNGYEFLLYGVELGFMMTIVIYYKFATSSEDSDSDSDSDLD